ncbi:MAG: hypothetical protein ACI9MR_001837 [Myxococcota bacterium]|jgi:hypothetical protein
MSDTPSVTPPAPIAEVADRATTTGGSNIISYEHRRLHRALPKLVGRCMSYSAMTQFDTSLIAAVRRYYGIEVDIATAEREILEDDNERLRFFPWFLWDWRNDSTSEKLAGSGGRTLPTLTVGEHFLAQLDGTSLDSELVVALCKSYLGFYEVSHSELELETVVLKDVATGEIVRVPDPMLADEVDCGQLLFARVIRLNRHGNDIGLVDALYAVLPPRARNAVDLELESLFRHADHRDNRAQTLKTNAPELLDFAEHLLDTLAQPETAINGDGDELTLCRATLAATDSQTLLRALSNPPAQPEATPGDRPIRPIGTTAWQLDAPDGSVGVVDATDPSAVVVMANSVRRHGLVSHTLARDFGISPPRLVAVEDFDRAVERWMGHGDAGSWLTVDTDVRAAFERRVPSWLTTWTDRPNSSLEQRTPRDAARRGSRSAVAAQLDRIEATLRGLHTDVIVSDRVSTVRRELGL